MVAIKAATIQPAQNLYLTRRPSQAAFFMRFCTPCDYPRVLLDRHRFSKTQVAVFGGIYVVGGGRCAQIVQTADKVTNTVPTNCEEYWAMADPATV